MTLSTFIQLTMLDDWDLLTYAWPAMAVFAWLPLFALGIVAARLLTPLSWIVGRTQWFLKEGKEHPLKAIGYVAAVAVIFLVRLLRERSLVQPHRRIPFGKDSVIEHPQPRKLVADAAHLGMNLVDDVLELISQFVPLALRLGSGASKTHEVTALHWRESFHWSLDISFAARPDSTAATDAFDLPVERPVLLDKGIVRIRTSRGRAR